MIQHFGDVRLVVRFSEDVGAVAGLLRLGGRSIGTPGRLTGSKGFGDRSGCFGDVGSESPKSRQKDEDVEEMELEESLIRRGKTEF